MTKASLSRAQRKLSSVAIEEKAEVGKKPTIDQATMERIERLVGGKEAPPTTAANHALRRLKAANAECGAADRNLVQGRAQIRQLETQLERLSGRVSVFVELLAEALVESDQAAKNSPSQAS
jgi:hypothetical protein